MTTINPALLPPTLNRTEYFMLRKIARTITSLFLSCTLLGVSLILSYSSYTYENAHAVLLKVSTGFAVVIMIPCVFILLTKGAADSQYFFMKILNFFILSVSLDVSILM
jgi:hypothetical protein